MELGMIQPLVQMQFIQLLLEPLFVCVGAGEDVEGVLVRLNAQSAENAVLRERQAKANSDMQVSPPLLEIAACIAYASIHNMLLLLRSCRNCCCCIHVCQC